MSMNLHCDVGGLKIDLIQTPTYVTYMCMVQSDGKISGQVTGKEAKRALYIYLEWVKFGISYQWPSKNGDERQLNKELVDGEILKINKILKSKGKLEVYLL